MKNSNELNTKSKLTLEDSPETQKNLSVVIMTLSSILFILSVVLCFIKLTGGLLGCLFAVITFSAGKKYFNISMKNMTPNKDYSTNLGDKAMISDKITINEGQKKPKEKQCPYCKKIIDSEAIVCPYCRHHQVTKSFLIAFAVVAAFIFIFLSPFILPSGNDKTDISTKTETKNDSISPAISFNTSEIISAAGAEPNTTGAVDALHDQAKKDATIATNADIEKAVQYISDNVSNFYKDNITMETAMYYGYLLDNAMPDGSDEDTIGYKTYMAIKYVYRGFETPEDSQIKLNQINELLGKAPTTNVPAENKKTNIPTEYKSALRKAKSYSDTMHMSKAGLYEQLTSEYGEQFSAEAAQYAIDNLDADYKANALAKAKSYQNNLSMSPAAIYDQLISEYGEQFTAEEAQYAIDNLE